MGLRGGGNGQETNYWGRRSVLRRKNCAELLPRIITKSDLSALTTAETHLCVRRFLGKRERALSSSVSLSLKRPARVDCREKFRFIRLRFGFVVAILRARSVDHTHFAKTERP